MRTMSSSRCARDRAGERRVSAPRGRAAQNPPAGAARPAAVGADADVPIQVMTLTSTAWQTAASIPVEIRAARARRVAGALVVAARRTATASFVLDRARRRARRSATAPTTCCTGWCGTFPRRRTSLPEGVPHGATLPDGSRQISASGPYYRGPAAPATGPPHHYVFELFALDTMHRRSCGRAVAAADARRGRRRDGGTRARQRRVMVGTFKRAAP